MVFRRFQGEGVEFFKSDLTDLPSDFWCASFGKYRFEPFQITFSTEFYIKIMFWLRWFCSLFYIKRYLFFAELALSQDWIEIIFPVIKKSSKGFLMTYFWTEVDFQTLSPHRKFLSSIEEKFTDIKWSSGGGARRHLFL